MKLVDINDDMRSMVQVFQKVSSLYDEFRKASKDLNISENIGVGMDELDDTLSVISGTSGFSSGSQMLPSKDYDDENCDDLGNDIVEKRINYLTRLDIPSQMFTSTSFDWAANMYSKVLEDICDSQGDYSALKEFHDALQFRLEQNYIPYSQRIHRLIVSLSDQGSRFSGATNVIKNQLKYELTLSDNEIQSMLNKLDDEAYKIENDKDTDEDSITDGFSDESEDDRSKKSQNNCRISTKDISKNWLLEQNRNLGTKVVVQLDDKVIRTEGGFTLIGSVFRSIIMNLLTYAGHDTKEMDSNRNWFQKNFPIHRIMKWNRFQLKKLCNSNDEIVIADEYSFFVNKMGNIILGESWNKNPIAVRKRKEFESMCIYEETKNHTIQSLAQKTSLPVVQNTCQLPMIHIPQFNFKLFENVNLWRDVGLIYEYPDEVVIHIVLKFIVSSKHNLKIDYTNIGFNEDTIICNNLYLYLSTHAHRFKNKTPITRNDMLIATLVVRHLNGKIEKDLENSIKEYISKVKDDIQHAVSESIVNFFYKKEETNNLHNVLEKYYDDLKDSEYIDRRTNHFPIFLTQNKDEAISCLVKALSEKSYRIEDTCNKSKKGKELWVKNQVEKMKRLWNFGPFERKIKQIIEKPGDYGKKIEHNRVLKC